MKPAVALALLTVTAPAFAKCPAPDRQVIADTVQAMFDAAAVDDTAKLATILAPGFYTFDVGTRYDARTFQEAIRDFHRSGKRIAWQVTSPDVHVSCDTAWITYVNKGKLTASGTSTPRIWLESAQLVYTNGAWRVAFLESAPVSDPAPVSTGDVPASTEITQQEIVKLEEDVYSALSKKDYARLELLIAEDYVQQEQDDEKITRKEIIDRLKSGKFDYESGKLGSVSVDVLGDVATAMYSADEQFTYAGKHISVHSYALDVWTRRNGRWMLFRTQSTSASKPSQAPSV